jgi:uncharacterized membrane protein
MFASSPPAATGGMPPAFRRMPLGRRADARENGFLDTLFRRAIMIFTPVILIHLATAIASVAVGGAMFLMKKGTVQHRLSGRLWVVLMAVTALVSFAIQSRGHFSWIHLLSLVVLFMLVRAVLAVRRRNIRLHQRLVIGTYTGLLIAGMFALAPWRRLGHLVWHAASLA